MVYPFPTHIFSHDLLCICLAEYQPSILCLLSSLKYKVHQLPKLKCFFLILKMPLRNLFRPGVKAKIKM